MSANSQRAAVLIEADDLQQVLRDDQRPVTILHVGGAPGSKGIAGAVPVSLGDFAGPGGGTRGERPLPEIAILQEAARRWGIGPESSVVLYDDKGGLQAARGWWVLRWAGLTGVRVLDGGLEAWCAAGGVLAELEPYDRKGGVTLAPGHLPTIEADDADGLAKTGRLIDARSAAAFDAGHIPGSLNLPASANLTASGHFASPDALSERFRPLSGTDGPLGVSCGSGVSAAHNVLALASIGIPSALYVASWSGWIADQRRVAETSGKADSHTGQVF